MRDTHTERLGIVVAVDGSPSSTAAVEWAARDADLRKVPLRIVHVMPSEPVAEGWYSVTMPDGFSQWQEEYAKQIVSEAHKLAESHVAPDRADQVTTEILGGAIVHTLVELSEHAELIAVGCRGQGTVAGALLGSVSSGLAHHAHCPVAVIHDEQPVDAQAPVVVGVDGSPTSELATEIAFDEASRRGVELVALHAWTDMGRLGIAKIGWAPIEWRNIKVQEEEVLAERLSGWSERYPDVEVTRVLVSDEPAPRLLEQAENAQLVVVGSHGRGAVPTTLLGSVSRTVVNSARVPVIVARVPHGHRPDHQG